MRYLLRFTAILITSVILPAASAAPRELSLQTAAKSVKQYAKVEFDLSVPTNYENPYDPDEVDLHLELTGPGNKRTILPAFYYVPFNYQPPQRGNDREWLYPTAAGSWKARFAPAELGAYEVVAVLKDRAGVVRSAPVRFEATPSQDHGFIRVSTKNPRYLAFDDGSPFFAVGQDVAFIKNSRLAGEMLARLGASGGNFARVWACGEDWALSVESRKSAWGRSWAWNPPIALMPGDEGFQLGRLCLKIEGDAGAAITCSPSRPVALVPGKHYRLSGRLMADLGVSVMLNLDGDHELSPKSPNRWTEFHHDFTAAPNQRWLTDPKFRLTAKGRAYLRDLSLKEQGSPTELLTEADVNRPLLGVYNQPDAFLLDRIVEQAEKGGVHLQLVMLTRNQYMPFLSNETSPEYALATTMAKRLARYFVARWGYSTHVASWEYFNEIDPHLPTDRFYTELGEYLEQTDPYHHLRATSAWSAPDAHWKNSKLDTADLHFYLRPAAGDVWKDAPAAVASRAKMMDQNAPCKPHIFAEFGITDDKWNRSPMIDADKQFLHLHDALWASAMSGFASTVCHWYWDDVHHKDMYHHYTPISRFVSQIPWNRQDLHAATAQVDHDLRVMGLQTSDRAYVWISDPQSTWFATASEHVEPQRVESATLSLQGLKPAKYQIKWFDTYTGKVLQTVPTDNKAGTATIGVPTFTRDIACRITPE